MIFSEFEQQYTDKMLALKLEIEEQGVVAFQAYFRDILLFIEQELSVGNRNIRLSKSIQETLEEHATFCIEKLYRGHNLNNAEQASLTALLVKEVNNRINGVVSTIDAWTQKQLNGAIRRAVQALEGEDTDRQVRRLVMKHLLSVWKNRAKNMVVSETQGNIETLSYYNNESVERQATTYAFLGDDEGLRRQLQSSTVFSYLVLADEVEEASLDKKIRVIRNRMKQWFTMGDSKVRPTHQAVHGTVVAKDAFFVVGGFPMLYPGDPSAPPQETANCRCVLVYR